MSSIPGKIEGGRRTLGGGNRTSSPEMPLVTVVTVVKNGAAHLVECIESVLTQSWSNIEYIIIDGGSTDGTMDIIRRYDDRIDYWLSKPDRGIFDAMNKGIALASGQLIGILNADDRYEPGAVTAAAQALMRFAAPAVFYGDHYLVQMDLGERYEMPASLQFWRGMTICHQAMFVHREVYQRLGGYDLRYRLAADYDFLLRACRAGVPFRHLERFVVDFRDGGASSRALLTGNREVSAILRSYYGPFSSPYLKNLLLTGYNLTAVAISRQIGRVLGERARRWTRTTYYRITGRRKPA